MKTVLVEACRVEACLGAKSAPTPNGGRCHIFDITSLGRNCRSLKKDVADLHVGLTNANAHGGRPMVDTLASENGASAGLPSGRLSAQQRMVLERSGRVVRNS